MNFTSKQRKIILSTNDHKNLKKEIDYVFYKNSSIFYKYLFVISFLLFYISTTHNIDQNTTDISFGSIAPLYRSITSIIRPIYEKKVVAKILTEIQTKIRFNLLIERTISFIKNFQSFLMDQNQIPSIDLKNKYNLKANIICLNEYEVISSYFQNFRLANNFKVFLETCDLSYFDGFFL